MLYQSLLLTATLLGHSLAIPSLRITIDIPDEGRVVSQHGAPRNEIFKFGEEIVQEPFSFPEQPVRAFKQSAAEIGKTMHDQAQTAANIGDTVSHAHRGNLSSVKLVLDQLQTQIMTFHQAINDLDGSDPVSEKDVADHILPGYIALVNGVLGEYRTMDGHTSDLCFIGALSPLVSALRVLANGFEIYEDFLKEIVPQCEDGDSTLASCELRGDMDGFGSYVPVSAEAVIKYLTGEEQSDPPCPY